MSGFPTLAILGAGCAGTLLALELRRQHFTGRIEIFDTRTHFDREQRWCFWGERGTRIPDVHPSHGWKAWRLAASGREEIVRTSGRYVYSHVHAPEFFRDGHARLATDGTVRLRLGCQVRALTARPGGGCRVGTDLGDMDADIVIDARHEGAAAFQKQSADGAIPLWQSFVGRIGEFSSPCAEPNVATLMDFRVRCSEGLAFGYVLPFSPTNALVEVAVLGAAPVPVARLNSLLDEYVARCGGGNFEVSGTEQGVLPMTAAAFTPGDRLGVVNIGVGGGSARPSSGYAFGRIVRATPALAHALCAGRRPEPPHLPWRHRWMDGIFLRVLRQQPEVIKQSFLSMFAEVPADRLIRFLTESSSIRDDLTLGCTLPRGAFVRAALRLRPAGFG